MSLRVHFNMLRFGNHTEEFTALLDPEIIVTENREIPDRADYEILVHPTPTREWIEASPNLRAIVIPWAGVPEQTRNLMLNYPEISVHNLHHNKYNTAEMCLTLLLAAAKRLIPMDQALRRNDWTPRYDGPQAVVLRGKTALILGFGEIGQTLASYCLGMGIKVIATKKHPDDYQGTLDVDIYPDELLHDLLPTTDFLLITLPLTNETQGLIGEAELKLLPRGSILVNIGRGPIVDPQALYDAVKSGHLRAAASDVWYNYPESKAAHVNTQPADLPFGELDNFVLSPHRGGFVEESEEQRAKAMARLLNAANRGQSIPNQVDLVAGY
jgi:phosphoglycerate dehydrogenase-like enzyme